MVVDDHHLFRAGVRAELAPHHDVVGEAATPAEALAVIAETAPDVVLLDVHLPEGGGVAVLEALREGGPKVLALSVSDAAEDVVPMIRAGALGYVTKTIDTEELLAAIATVAAGDACFSPRLAAFVLQAFSAPVQAKSELEALTPREREVLHHLARGYPYKGIAPGSGSATGRSSPTSAPCCASSSSAHATRSATGPRRAGSSATTRRDQPSGWLKRSMLPAGSRKAQSRTPYGMSIGSCSTSAPAARMRSKVASTSSVLKITPRSRPLASSSAMACLSAGEAFGSASGGSRTMSTSGCDGDPTVTQRIPSYATSLRTSKPSTSR